MPPKKEHTYYRIGPDGRAYSRQLSDDTTKSSAKELLDKNRFAVNQIRLLAGVYGFIFPSARYTSPPIFSLADNSNACDWRNLTVSKRSRRTPHEWLRIYGDQIINHCTPTTIIKMRLQLERTDHNKVRDLLYAFRTFATPEVGQRLLTAIEIMSEPNQILEIGMIISAHWRDWIDPKFIGLYREPAQPKIPAVLKTPDKEPNGE